MLSVRKRLAFKMTVMIVCASMLFTTATALTRCPVKAVSRDFLAYSPTPEDIEKAKKERDEAKKKAEEAADKVSQLKGEKSELTGELEELQGLSDEQMEQYTRISEEYAAALIAKEDALNEYITSQETLIAKREEYSERISVMFAYENKSTLEILLSSDSIAGFFTNLELISLIGDADRQMIDQLTIAMDDAELKSEVALQEALDMEEIAEAKQAELKELEDRIGVTQEALDETNDMISTWQQKEDDFQAEADRLDDEVRRLQKEYEEEQKKKATPTPKPSCGGGGGGTAPSPSAKMTWPYPGDYTIYSPYGMRVHPVYGTQKMHWGVDLGGSYGNPIVAAADGVVILVDEPVEGQNTGGTNYGNYCIIDHGNGVCTLYGHCRDVKVSVGDHVTAGQTIAECGSTGTSTGPHLHFEVRVNGEKVDPAPYIKG